MRFINKFLTKNFKAVPLLWVNFSLKHYREHGAKNSCMCRVHPSLAGDDYIIDTLNDLCDYIRETYDMEDLV